VEEADVGNVIAGIAFIYTELNPSYPASAVIVCEEVEGLIPVLACKDISAPEYYPSTPNIVIPDLILAAIKLSSPFIVTLFR
jgi:hypothetical protein